MMTSQQKVTGFPDELLPVVSSLLVQSGRSGEFQLKPLLGGANNRLFQVQQESSSTVLKWYFSDPQDRRDRLKAEWDFSMFSWQHGLRQIAKPLALDHKSRLGLYTFHPGKPITAAQIDENYVRQAASFYQQINCYRDAKDAHRLPLASEACFSIAAHLESVSGRVSRLHQAVSLGFFSKACSFVEDVLLERWQQVQQQVHELSTKQKIDLQAESPLSTRGLSPSDFGFHNALLDADGTLRFFDFEYAGWDDPAKTVCDFFCQVEVPVSKKFIIPFIEEMSGDLFDADWLSRRAELLLPAYRIKWCCIILNPLLSVGKRRRDFSNSSSGRETSPSDELKWTEQARQLLESEE